MNELNPPPAANRLAKWRARCGWLAGEPYRIFFLSGALWSVVGAALWLVYYAGILGFYPGLVHARVMIEGFGGGFVVGFIGTAGPRMISAPRLTVPELVWLWGWHEASAVFQLMQRPEAGDLCFALLLGSLLLALGVRWMAFREEPAPPALILVMTGLLCGIVGAGLGWASFREELDSRWVMLGRVLLYQGLLLPPVLGVGTFLFPRILGGRFPEATDPGWARQRWVRAWACAAGLLLSFVLESRGEVVIGRGLRCGVAIVYLGLEVPWRRRPESPPWGSWVTGLWMALGLGVLGLTLSATGHPQHVSIEHLLYIGGFGLLMLVVGSRVILGHSGGLERFHAQSRRVRILIGLGVLAAATRAVVAWVPSILVSHHFYAAAMWTAAVLCWLIGHRRRFFKADEDDEVSPGQPTS